MMTQEIEFTTENLNALVAELANLRGGMDGLAAALRQKFGADAPAATPCEQVSAALQRLEWTLSSSKNKRASSANQ